MKKYASFLFAFAFILSACTAKATAVTGTWKLIAYGPLESMTPAVADASLTFGDDGTLSGSGGCNSLGGEYKVEDKTMTFSNVASTLMACDDARMTQESVVTQVLSGTAEWEIENQTLAVTNNDMVLVFSQVPAK